MLYSTLYHPVIQVHYSLLTVCTQLTTNWGGGGGRENIGHRTGSGEEREITLPKQLHLGRGRARGRTTEEGNYEDDMKDRRIIFTSMSSDLLSSKGNYKNC